MSRCPGYLRRYLAHPEEVDPHRGQQIRLFQSPTVLGNWYPHFTLLNPYSGHDVGGVASLLTRLFEPSPHITMRSKVRSPMTEAGRSQRPIIRSAPLQIDILVRCAHASEVQRKRSSP